MSLYIWKIFRENTDKTTRKMDKSCSILAPYFGYSWSAYSHFSQSNRTVARYKAYSSCRILRSRDKALDNWMWRELICTGSRQIIKFYHALSSLLDPPPNRHAIVSLHLLVAINSSSNPFLWKTHGYSTPWSCAYL